MRRVAAVTAVVAVAVALPVTACGRSAAPPPRLLGVVGEPDDPDAYTMTLTDAQGRPVRSLPAGDYEVVVRDLSAVHNFHLRGPAAEESTSVPQTGETTWRVRLEPGEHTYVCDPHLGMTERFTVT